MARFPRVEQALGVKCRALFEWGALEDSRMETVTNSQPDRCRPIFISSGAMRGTDSPRAARRGSSALGAPGRAQFNSLDILRAKTGNKHELNEQIRNFEEKLVLLKLHLFHLMIGSVNTSSTRSGNF